MCLKVCCGVNAHISVFSAQIKYSIQNTRAGTVYLILKYIHLCSVAHNTTGEIVYVTLDRYKY